jgi:hypothetical protein
MCFDGDFAIASGGGKHQSRVQKLLTLKQAIMFMVKFSFSLFFA